MCTDYVFIVSWYTLKQKGMNNILAKHVRIIDFLITIFREVISLLYTKKKNSIRQWLFFNLFFGGGQLFYG